MPIVSIHSARGTRNLGGVTSTCTPVMSDKIPARHNVCVCSMYVYTAMHLHNAQFICVYAVVSVAPCFLFVKMN